MTHCKFDLPRPPPSTSFGTCEHRKRCAHRPFGHPATMVLDHWPLPIPIPSSSAIRDPHSSPAELHRVWSMRIRLTDRLSNIPVWGESTGGRFTCRVVLFAFTQGGESGRWWRREGGVRWGNATGSAALREIPWIWSFRWKRIRYLAFRLSTDWRTMPANSKTKNWRLATGKIRGQRTHVTPNDRWNCQQRSLPVCLSVYVRKLNGL